MMTQYRFAVRFQDQRMIPSSMAYPLYSWLLTQVSGDIAARLHQQGGKPVSQYLRQEKNTVVWTVSCLNSETSAEFQPVLDSISSISLHSGLMKAELIEKHIIDTVEQFTVLAREKNRGPYCRMVFASPTSFKHDGQYVILPQIRLLLRSLAEKWNNSFSDYPLDDPETLNTVEQSLKLVDYRLQSCRFPLKGVQIPGFVGQISIRSDLSAPLMDVWKSLTYYAEFSGIGMKTALGMGGVYLHKGLQDNAQKIEI